MNNQKSENNILIESILFVAMIISLVVWTIVGFVIYIPIVLRMTSYYCGMVVLSAFSPVDLNLVKQRLDYAVHLYPDTFAKIIDSFKSNYSEREPMLNFKPINWSHFWEKALVDIIWTLIFWFGFFSLILQ